MRCLVFCAILASGTFARATVDSYVNFLYPAVALQTRGPCLNRQGLALDPYSSGLASAVTVQIQALLAPQNVLVGHRGTRFNSNALSSLRSQVKSEVWDPTGELGMRQEVLIKLTFNKLKPEQEKLLYYTIAKSALLYAKKVWIEVAGSCAVPAKTQWPITQGSRLIANYEAELVAQGAELKCF